MRGKCNGDGDLQVVHGYRARNLLGHMGRETSGLMMGIFRLVTLVLAEETLLIPSRSLAVGCEGSVWSSLGLGGLEEEEWPESPEMGDGEAAGLILDPWSRPMEHPLDIRREAVGEGWCGWAIPVEEVYGESEEEVMVPVSWTDGGRGGVGCLLLGNDGVGLLVVAVVVVVVGFRDSACHLTPTSAPSYWV